jgi:lipopolysaccharide export system protein LptA
MREKLTGAAFFALGALIFAGSGFAERGTNPAEILIEGASAEFDKANSTITYRGDVEAKMDSVAINGEFLLVNLSEDKIELITTSGTPARFSQAANPDTGRPDDTSAEASKIIYFPEENRLELVGKAKLTQGRNLIRSPSIRYNILDGEVEAGDQAGQNRVQMQLLLPKTQADGNQSNNESRN